MSKFDYKAEGNLNSQYVLELLSDYLLKIANINDTKGIIEDDFKINVKSNKFARWFNDSANRFKLNWKSKTLLENYNKVLAVQYVKSIQDKIQIFLQTNVLEARQLFELKETLKAIKFDIVLPELDENRNNAIRKSEKEFLKVLSDIKYLKNADIDYVLFNSPVVELKPFLSDKVNIHKVNHIELQNLVRQFVGLKHSELTTFDFEPFEYAFKSKAEDFYEDNITDSGIGEEVEGFIREKMWQKLEISQQQLVLSEEKQNEIDKIDTLLKKLKINKIEQMMQELIRLKTNQAQAKEVIDKCKDTINSSTIPNKAEIFLLMDNMYYKLSKKCEALQAKIKLKLQLVDKQRLFDTLAQLQEAEDKNPSKKHKKQVKQSSNEKKSSSQTDKKSISDGLYEEDDEDEIHITEDDGTDEPEEEVVIDDVNDDE